MADDLREKIAEVLAGHRRKPGASLSCECGRLIVYTGRPHQERADYERHVAEAILAALGEVREEWRVVYESRGQTVVWWTADTREDAHRSLTTARLGGWPNARAEIRTVRKSPWRPVDTEDPRRALTEGQTDG